MTEGENYTSSMNVWQKTSPQPQKQDSIKKDKKLHEKLENEGLEPARNLQ